VHERDHNNANRPAVPSDPSGIPEPHDTLAAEEFVIGTRFERWPAYPAHDGPPHDTLAAEEFGIGTRDERMPRDPSGYDSPHDILAAEAFAMPLPDRGGAMPAEAGRSLVKLGAIAAAAAGLAVLLLSRR
jgi:hypothetical protein